MLLLAFWLAFLTGHPAQALESAMPVAGKSQSAQIRAQSVKALRSVASGQWTQARDIIAATKDPLASKLYYWLLFTKNKGGDSQYVHLAQFIRHNPQWPALKDLRVLAEQKMPGDLSPAEVTAWFNDYPPETARGVDRYLQALLGQGQRAKAKDYLTGWWATTKLTREEQKDIYRKYALFIDQKAHRQRFDTLLFAGQYTNARAIAAVLGQGYSALTEARIALAEEEPNAGALISKVPRELQNDPGLLFERLRWRRRNNLDVPAMEILHKMPPADQIHNAEDWWQERHILIRRLIEKKHYESAYLLAKEHAQKDGLSYAQAEWMAGWLSLRFLNNAPQGLAHFNALYKNVETPVSKARAAYWAGRAAKEMNAAEAAQSWFKDAARFQTVFYGQLAGAELGIEQSLPNAAPPVITAEDVSMFNALELVQAARLFHEAGMRNEASNFIQAFVKHEKTPKAYRFGAELAADMGHYHDALRIAKEATKEGMFLTAQSYPVITDRLGHVSVEWALVHALIRQESMFDQNAQSPVGALGLMQLMPATARETARKISVAYQPGWLTARPDYNIRLGSKYLSDMLARFDGSYPMAIAAYNAGPGRVNQWVEDYGDPRTGQVDLIDWIEMMPIYETRNYVQRVMESVYVYRLRLKGVQKPSDHMIHIAMPYQH